MSRMIRPFWPEVFCDGGVWNGCAAAGAMGTPPESRRGRSATAVRRASRVRRNRREPPGRPAMCRRMRSSFISSGPRYGGPGRRKRLRCGRGRRPSSRSVLRDGDLLDVGMELESIVLQIHIDAIDGLASVLVDEDLRDGVLD